jgi:hypothetical protein
MAQGLFVFQSHSDLRLRRTDARFTFLRGKKHANTIG